MIEDRLNDEIKEILNKLKETADYPKINYSSYDKSFNETIDNVAMIKSFACKQLLDYITNLQQENEYLKKNQRFHKKFGSDYIFCLEGDKETYKDMVLEKQEEIEQLQQAVKESINLLWKSDISTSKGLEIINILRSCLKSE